MAETTLIEVVLAEDGSVTKLRVFHRSASGTKAWTHPYEEAKACDVCVRNAS
jgi:hypothetical protein